MYMIVCLNVYLCATVCRPVMTRKECQGSESSDRDFGPHAVTGATESCESPCGYWQLNPVASRWVACVLKCWAIFSVQSN